MAARAALFVIATALLLFHTYAHFTGTMEELEALGTAPGFSYTGNTGPSHWANLTPAYASCATGKWQSPVDIVKDKVVLNKTLRPLRREYQTCTNATLVDHGYNVGIVFGNAGVLIVDGKNYSLLQMHWHVPSEHKIDGVSYAAELHLVHQASDGAFSVIAMLYEFGKPDPIVSKMQRKLAELAKVVSERHEVVAQVPMGTFRTRKLMRHTRKYYRYGGSLTTPPCFENVIWHVIAKVRSMSREQVEALDAPLESTCKRNCRPVQPLNGRQIELFDELA